MALPIKIIQALASYTKWGIERLMSVTSDPAPKNRKCSAQSESLYKSGNVSSAQHCCKLPLTTQSEHGKRTCHYVTLLATQQCIKQPPAPACTNSRGLPTIIDFKRSKAEPVHRHRVKQLTPKQVIPPEGLTPATGTLLLHSVRIQESSNARPPGYHIPNPQATIHTHRPTTTGKRILLRKPTAGGNE